jgi:hypothetical protein
VKTKIIVGTQPAPLEQRPLCPTCKKRLRPILHQIDWNSNESNYSFAGYGYLGKGVFCTLSCGYAYGLASYRNGRKSNA